MYCHGHVYCISCSWTLVIDNADVGKESPYDEEETIQDHLEKHFETWAQHQWVRLNRDFGSHLDAPRHVGRMGPDVLCLGPKGFASI